jgi:hypothetical protein
VSGVVAPWDGECGPAIPWFESPAQGLLLGDARAADAGLRVGALLKAEREWLRVAFTPPSALEREATDVSVEPFPVPPGSEPVRARLDHAGRLHLLYRLGNTLSYVPPGAKEAAWRHDRLGALARETAHLILRPGTPPTLVAYDAERGAVLVRL